MGVRDAKMMQSFHILLLKKMRKEEMAVWKRRYAALAAAAGCVMAGCGMQGREMVPRETAMETADAESAIKEYGIFNYDYTGYQDECVGWGDYESFVGQDYDRDGKVDRVYKEYREDADANFYRIEFGNGDVIAMDCGVSGTAFLNIKSADINGDGNIEMVLSFLYGASTDMRGAGGMAVYEKQGDGYKKAVLPFREKDADCSQSVSVRYQTVRDGLIQVSVEDGWYETVVPIPTVQWDSLAYDRYYGNAVEDCVVWDNYLLEKDEGTRLVCKVHLFDKWSDCGLFAVLGYKDGRYVIDRWMRTNEEFSEEPAGEDSCWSLTDYLLCSRIMETGGQLVSVGLWLDSGTYGSEEEFVPGMGVYEENFRGEYYLRVVDREGHILSERSLAQDFDVGSNMNFPGAFELVERDYNKDACPDFTIGAAASSSMNVYALYTIWKDGTIGLLCRDIPNDSPGEFSVELESGTGTSFSVHVWNNAIGEEEQMFYEWDEERNCYKNP